MMSGGGVYQSVIARPGRAFVMFAVVILGFLFSFPTFAAALSKQALIDAAPFFVDACRRSGKSEYLKIDGYETMLACIDGEFENDSVTALENWEGAGDSLTVVAISGGGLAGLAIGLVEKWGVGEFDIIIDRDCHSACTNNLFAGARNKIILGIASLSWHGGMARSKDELLFSMSKQGSEELSKRRRELAEEYWARFSGLQKRRKAIYEKQSYIEDIIYMLPAAAQCAVEERGGKLAEIYSVYDDEDITSEHWRPSRTVLTEVFKFTNVYFQNPALFDENIYQLGMNDGREFVFKFSTDCLMKNYALHAVPAIPRHK